MPSIDLKSNSKRAGERNKIDFKKRAVPFKKTSKSNTLLGVHKQIQRKRYFLTCRMNFFN